MMSTILIVDDDKSARITLESILFADNYTLVFAHDGFAALEQARICMPDLVLLDVMMPGMDGFEVCRRMRATPLLAEVPIILITAIDDRDSRLRGLEAGADDFLSKPVDLLELRARVRVITRLNRYRLLMSERLKFERLADRSPNGILIVNADTGVLFANPAIERLVGRESAALHGQAACGLFHVAWQQQCREMLRAALDSQGDNHHFEATWVHADETLFPVEIDATAIEWDSAPAVQLIVRDVSRRKRTEADLSIAYQHMVEMKQQMQRSRDMLRTLIDGMDNGLALIDYHATVLTVNHALTRLIGSTPEDLAYRSWYDLQCVSDPPFPGQVVLDTLADGQAHRARVQYVAQEGRHYVLDVDTLPFTSLTRASQVADLIIVHVVDMTEQVQLEAMALANARFAANGTLAATVAHEVNTPLHTIKTSLYLADKADEARRSDYLAVAREEIDRVSHILRQLLDLYRTSEGAVSDIDVNALMERLLLLTGSSLARNGIQVTYDLDPALPHLVGHPDQITQVLLNLVLNAVDAMPAGGDLHLHTSSAPPGTADSVPAVVIKVADTGIGMTPEVQARIFEPFFTTKPEGSGLGVAISQRIVQQHGGTLTLTSSPGAGSTFTVALPLERQEQEQVDVQSNPGEHTTGRR